MNKPVQVYDVTNLPDFTGSLDVADFTQFKNGTEQAFFGRLGREAIAQTYGSPVILMLYEWFAFNLPGAIYTPDFAAYLEDGRLVIVETKGSKGQQHYQITRNKLRIVASLNPMFVFCMAFPTKTGWKIDQIKPDKRLSSFILNMATLGDRT